MEKHSPLSTRLSPTIGEAQRIVRQLTEEQREFLLAFDHAAQHPYSLPELGERMGLPGDYAESYAERKIYRPIGRIIQKELSASFDMAYMEQHGCTSWPTLLLNCVKIKDRWYFTLGPELHAALVEEGVLEV